MYMKRFIFALAALVAFFGASSAVAQNGAFAPYVTAGVGVQGGNLSYANKTNPSFTFGGGIESSTKFLLLDANATYNTANNVVTQNGYTIAAQGSGYFKLDHVLLGVGVNESINNLTRTNLQAKLVPSSFQSFHPFVGVGYQTTKFRATATYDLPAKDAINNERIVNFNGEVFATKHIRATGGVLIDSTVPTGGTRQLAVGASAGIKLVL
jgi:hypothetical protein